MKIAYILNTYPQPSQSFIRRELKGLERLGLSVDRIAMRRSDLPLKDPQDREELGRTSYVLEAGKVALLLSLLRALVGRPGTFAAAWKAAMGLAAVSPLGRVRHLIYLVEACHVLRLVQAGGVEHMHAHFGTNAAAVAMLVRVLGGPSYSFTVHGPEEFDAVHSLSLARKMEEAAFTVAVSSYGRSQLCRWLPHTAWSGVKVVHCGIDPEMFPEPGEMPDKGLRLVNIGRLSEQKGQLILMPVMSRVVGEVPEARLTLIGDGELRGALEAEISERGLGDHVTLAGWQAEDEVRDALAGCHALVLPSFAEGLPMVIMEAMAAGRPVISTYVAGIPELVQEGVTGWLVPAGDDAALAEAVLALEAMSAEERAALGRAGRARVLERHDMYREAEKLAGHFRAAVDRG
ncbi:glycosyltransferase [Roseovarius indicus]|uniref:Glycoside hydrolase n=1 Tax=Roseovarius indicus TaxID=540747 RepID=A0A0T5P1I9_9RHOB|nr:glycosyltransferase [Roseovarius indicus]KRS14994.1 glycoside hydrolase [Roseovarius indicus]